MTNNTNVFDVAALQSAIKDIGSDIKGLRDAVDLLRNRVVLLEKNIEQIHVYKEER